MIMITNSPKISTQNAGEKQKLFSPSSRPGSRAGSTSGSLAGSPSSNDLSDNDILQMIYPGLRPDSNRVASRRQTLTALRQQVDYSDLSNCQFIERSVLMLKSLDEILRGVVSFWENIDVLLETVETRGEYVERFVAFSKKNQLSGQVGHE